MIDATVVIPTHNRLHLLSTAIGSVLRQVGVSLEVIVVDDGSTDGTGPWLDRLAAKDSRIKVIHHERPQLLPSARNAGIARASAAWVAFCDDDDLWAADKLVSQLRALEATAAQWACTGVIVVNEELEILGHNRPKGGDVLFGLLEENLISSSSVIADRHLMQRLGGFDPTLRSSEDWDMWIRLAQHSELAAVDRPLVAYRMGMRTMSMDIDQMRKSRTIIADRYARLAIEHGGVSAEARHERYLAKQLLRAGSGRKAAAIFASLAVKHKRWRELPRVAAALLAPRLTDRVGNLRAAAAIPHAWHLEAETWLRPLRQMNGTSFQDHRTKRKSGRFGPPIL